MKSLWKGTLSFSLVSIPVKLYSATHQKDIHFHMLHKKCSTPINYLRHCPHDNMDVPWEEIVHGYEFEKGRYVVLTDEDLDTVPIKSTHTMGIIRFVGPQDIDPIYFDKTYYIEPAGGSERAYVLFRDTMEALGIYAMCKVSFRAKEHIAVIRPLWNTLALHTLYYSDEILRPDELNIPVKMDLDPKEKSLASSLMKQFSGKFNIAAYHDEYREVLMEIIKARIEGKKIVAPAVKEAEKVVSLMDALKKSLDKGPHLLRETPLRLKKRKAV